MAEEPLLPVEAPPDTPSNPWRIGAAFWLLGLANNLPYVVMLSAARDILDPQLGPQVLPPSGNQSRFDCTPLATGAVLLADILPTLLIKVAAPFGLHRLPYNIRVVTSALCAWGSFSLVAWGRGVGISLGGVALASAASGLGEVTLLALAGDYSRSGLSGWSSGTGGAGLGGALGFGALRGAGLPLPHCLLPGLALPPLTLLSYFFLLGPPPAPPEPPPLSPPEEPTAAERRAVAKVALLQATPLAIVYFLEYLSNQGLLELLYFPSSSLTHGDQYRWYQLFYQGGVFVSRSSLRCFRIRRLWIFPLLQALTVALLAGAVATPFLPGVGVAFTLISWEGLVGGGAYGSCYLSISEKAPPWGRSFAVTVASLAESVAVALAGGAAMGVHRLVCPTVLPHGAAPQH